MCQFHASCGGVSVAKERIGLIAVVVLCVMSLVDGRFDGY